jgi:3-oxoacyl-[acyl-carrier protein] reductase
VSLDDAHAVGRNALVTGGAVGIGRSISLALAADGVNIVVADLDMEGARRTARKVEQLGVRGIGSEMDVAHVENHRAYIAHLEADFGPIDILVNNAGVTSTTKLLEMTPQEWDFVVGVDCRGTFFLTLAVYERMLARRSGRIISVASISGERGARFAGAHYSISKAGVIMMTRVFALHAADSGVTVNAVSPGIIDTEMTARPGTEVDPRDVPMNRMGAPADVAAAVTFLASDRASYITGQTLSVNGGQSMR